MTRARGANSSDSPTRTAVDPEVTDARDGALRPLAGRTAVVTGASRGIGHAIAQRLTESGVRTCLVARGREALQDATRALGSHALAVPCDVADASALARAVDRVRELLGGAPDIVVNNAGSFSLHPIEDTTPELFAATMQVNVLAPFQLVRAFIGDLRSRGLGDIVTIGSVADRTAFPDNGAYAASKHAQRAFHEVLRQELHGSGVRATLVSPAPTDTSIWDPFDPDNREGFPPRALMLRPADVADAVLWAVTRPAHVNIDELRLSHG